MCCKLTGHCRITRLRSRKFERFCGHFVTYPQPDQCKHDIVTKISPSKYRVSTDKGAGVGEAAKRQIFKGWGYLWSSVWRLLWAPRKVWEDASRTGMPEKNAVLYKCRPPLKEILEGNQCHWYSAGRAPSLACRQRIHQHQIDRVVICL